MFMYWVTAGIFAFLVAVVFGARAKRYRAGYTPDIVHEGHSSGESHDSHSRSEGGGKKMKKYTSDGKPTKN